MKKLLILIICSALIIFTFFNYDKISSYLADFVSQNHSIVIKDVNNYAKNEDYMFVQNVTDFTPYSYFDLLNIIYSGINNGWTTFTFYCAPEYTDCINDIIDISNDKILLSHIDNFVHPYNSFVSLNTIYSTSGEITIETTKLYSDEDIKKIDNAADEFIKKHLNTNNSDYDNIKILHDEIINNTKYDKEAEKHEEINYPSKTANGVFFHGLATCNGYTDAMAILLSKMGIKNFKIATTPVNENENGEGHVWNAVYVDNKWLHLDLTWDDPVSDNGKDYLFHSYFLVTNDALKKADAGQVQLTVHNYDKEVYLEFNDEI